MLTVALTVTVSVRVGLHVVLVQRVVQGRMLVFVTVPEVVKLLAVELPAVDVVIIVVEMVVELNTEEVELEDVLDSEELFDPPPPQLPTAEI